VFLGAAFRGDLPRVQKMLGDGEALITDVDHVGRTALLHAAIGGFRTLSALKWLLEEGGARITERDHHGSSALLLAAACSRLTKCQWLLEHG
jgi:ankyrin repeat protein